MLSSTGGYSETYYPAINDNAPFVIDSTTGEIRTFFPQGYSLDYETDQSFTFKVEARDNKDGKYNSNITIVTVNIGNVNDEKPELDQSMSTIEVLNTKNV